MGEVRRLRGNEEVFHPGKPNKDVVVELEALLEQARSGEITGFAAAYMYFDGAAGTVSAGSIHRSIVGNLFGLATRISLRLDR